MKITEVKVTKMEREDSHILGIASVTLDDCFKVERIRIRQDKEGNLHIAMPSRPKTYINEDGEEVKKYIDMAHPINQETRKMFEDAIFEEYNKLKEE
ncbi:MAG: SpoVG family protein [Bacilli bacterium]|nr:SpoVG family protein [Bacilli bacterium]